MENTRTSRLTFAVLLVFAAAVLVGSTWPLWQGGADETRGTVPSVQSE